MSTRSGHFNYFGYRSVLYRDLYIDTAVTAPLAFHAKHGTMLFSIYTQGRTGHACIWAMPGGPVGCKQKTGHFYVGKKVISEFFYDFARAGSVGWKVIGKLPGPVFNASPPLYTLMLTWLLISRT